MKTDKRENYLRWDEIFMLMTDLIAQRSKDPNSQVGACIVNDKNIIVGLGYNGFPRGCSDDKLPWKRKGETLKTKYAFVVHAEANAIMNSNTSVEGCRLYCNLFPCNECSKLIIQNGIKEVIYQSDKYKDVDIFKAGKKMLKMAGVKLRQYTSKNKLYLRKNKQCKKR